MVFPQDRPHIIEPNGRDLHIFLMDPLFETVGIYEQYFQSVIACFHILGEGNGKNERTTLNPAASENRPTSNEGTTETCHTHAKSP
jgi:hypothetical protein